MSVNDPMMESKHHDPMLDGITAYTMDVECMSYCYGGSPRLEEDKYPDDNCVVKWSDLPALIAAARVDAVRDYAEAHYANKMQRSEERYQQGYAAALDAAREAVAALAPTWAVKFYVPRPSNGEWIGCNGAHEEVDVLAAIDALTEREAPEPLGADLAAEIAAHDNKGFSEERCLRCGWVMGSPALNCNNDDTPHRFPSHSPISHSGEAPEPLGEVT